MHLLTSGRRRRVPKSLHSPGPLAQAWMLRAWQGLAGFWLGVLGRSWRKAGCNTKKLKLIQAVRGNLGGLRPSGVSGRVRSRRAGHANIAIAPTDCGTTAVDPTAACFCRIFAGFGSVLCRPLGETA